MKKHQTEAEAGERVEHRGSAGDALLKADWLVKRGP